MLLVLLVVGAIMLVSWRPQPEAVKVVDVTPAITVATMQAEFPVLVPSGLAAEWRPTSARWEPTEESDPDPVLHIGYVTPAGEYAQVSQSANVDEAYLQEQTDDGTPVDESQGTTAGWSRWDGKDRRSLVRESATGLTVVSGTAAWDELEQLATSLTPVAAVGS